PFSCAANVVPALSVKFPVAKSAVAVAVTGEPGDNVAALPANNVTGPLIVPVPPRIALPLIDTAEPAAVEPSISNEPALTVVTPVSVFVPVSVSVPDPVFVRPTVPLPF